MRPLEVQGRTWHEKRRKATFIAPAKADNGPPSQH